MTDLTPFEKPCRRCKATFLAPHRWSARVYCDACRPLAQAASGGKRPEPEPTPEEVAARIDADDRRVWGFR